MMETLETWILTLQSKCVITFFDHLITPHTHILTHWGSIRVFELQPVYFYPLLCKSISCGYSFELP